MVTECVSAFCVDFWLQTNLFQSGVLWHLLPNLFKYDFTLDEGGVEKSQESNQQVCFHVGFCVFGLGTLFVAIKNTTLVHVLALV